MAVVHIIVLRQVQLAVKYALLGGFLVSIVVTKEGFYCWEVSVKKKLGMPPS